MRKGLANSAVIGASILGMVAALAMAATLSPSPSPWVQPRVSNPRYAAAGGARLHAYGGRRGTVDDKLDTALADLARRPLPENAAAALAELHSASPAARFKMSADGVTPLIAIDAVTRGDAGALQSALERLGLERAARYANDVGGWLPVARLDAAAATAEVTAVRAALSRTRSGAVTTQGDFAQQTSVVRSSDALSGSGVTVGVLSDSYDCYAAYAAAGSGVPAAGFAGYASNGFTATAAADVSSGDLPAGVSVLKEADCANYGAPLFPPLGDEGRAMLQIVHDVAPGAALAFYTAETSEADFATGIGRLAAAGAKVIADDVGYLDEPFYQDGLIAQAVNSAQSGGVAYFSAAGNDGDSAYENTAPSFATAAPAGGDNAGEYLLNFDTSGATTTTVLPITLDALQPGEFAAIVVQWDQPYVTGAPASGGAVSRIDLCVSGGLRGYTIENYSGTAATCTGANAAGVDPVQILIVANPANATAATATQTLNLSVGLAAGSAAPGRIKVAVETDGQTDAPLAQFATHSSTLQGHAGAAGALAVGAAFYFSTPSCGTTPAVAESYSALGGTPILFDATGTRLAAPLLRQKPDVVGPDGGNDTFLGFALGASSATSISACQNDTHFPNFFGTSAATPHVASIAALMLQKNPAATPTQIYAALRSSASPMGQSTPNYVSGYGFVQAPAALDLIPAAATPVTTAGGGHGGGGSLSWLAIGLLTAAAVLTAAGRIHVYRHGGGVRKIRL